MQLGNGGSDSDVPMDRWSRKLLRLSVLACGFLLFSAFSGDLTATMTAGDSGAVPRDFGEVLERGYTVVVANGVRTALWAGPTSAGPQDSGGERLPSRPTLIKTAAIKEQSKKEMFSLQGFFLF